jgi:D-3-phosphoglycerate dehydrogenase / 2-oxoglutarate reductase
LHLLEQEFAEHYNAYVAGRSPQVDPVRLQPGPYAISQRETPHDAVVHEYWRDKLRDLPAVRWPHDGGVPYTRELSDRAERISFKIGTRLHDQIRLMCKKLRVTPFTLFASASMLLLYAESKDPDVIIGCPLSHRGPADLDLMIAPLTGLLPLRLRIQPGEPVTKLITGMQRTLREAMMHRNILYEDIARMTRARGRAARTPLCPLVLVVDDATDSGVEIPGVAARRLFIPSRVSKFYLYFYFLVDGGSYSAYLDYSTDMFAEPVARRFTRDFVTLLDLVTSCPDNPITELTRTIQLPSSQVRCREPMLRKRKALRALLLENIHPDAAARLAEAGCEVEALPRRLEGQDLLQAIQGVNVLGIRSGSRLTEQVIANAPDLLAVGAFCVDTNHIDLAAARRRGIAVFNAPFTSGRSVAELAIASIMAMARKLTQMNERMHAGVWDKSSVGMHEIRGRTLGIIGYGNIGTQVSVLAEALGMIVYYYDIVDRPAVGSARPCSTLTELLESVETVSLHVDGREANRGFFGEGEFAAMRPASSLVNLSRGSVVDYGALRRHIDTGHIAGAAIDVFPVEGKGKGEPFTSELCGLPNVILTPHIGSSTEEAQQRIAGFVSDKLASYVDSGATQLCASLPAIALPLVPGTRRIAHVCVNLPRVLASINQVIARHGGDIAGQILGSLDDVGYLLTDVRDTNSDEILTDLRGIEGTVRLRVTGFRDPVAASVATNEPTTSR